MSNEQNPPAPDNTPDTPTPTQSNIGQESAPGPRYSPPEPGTPAAFAGSSISPQTARRRRNVLIGVGAGVAAVAIGGAAFAIGAEIGRDDDPAPAASQVSAQHSNRDFDPDRESRHSSSERKGSNHDTPSTRQIPATPENAPSSAGSTVAADAESLQQAARAAIAAVGGSGASSVSAERTGYKVDVLLGDGTDIEVFVDTNGQTIRGEQGHDRQTDQPLDLAKIGDITAAALAAANSASGTTGTIESVSTSNNRSGAVYETSVRLANGQQVDVELAADLSTVRTEIDD